jgi:hypothetical protein
MIMWLIRDLLSLVASDDPLEVRVGRNGTYVDGLSEWPIRCVEEAMSLMTRGANNRAVGHANPEEHYTRSHMVHLIKVEISCLFSINASVLNCTHRSIP